MALSSDEIVVTGTGHIYVAPVGTAFPANVGVTPSVANGWTELGYASEEGARFSFGREINSIMGWQSFDPLRKVVTAVPKTVSFDLMQWNMYTVQLAFGGGAITEPTSGNYVYTPPAESFLDERALIIEGTDGASTYRFCFRKALNEEGVDFAFVRSDPVLFPITMGILAADNDADAYFIQTNDPDIGEVLDAAS